MTGDAGGARGAPTLIGIGLFVATLVWCSLTHGQGLGLSDEGYMLRVSARVLAGEIVHRDFIELYPPGVHWLTGLALWLGDGEILAVRWLLTLWKGVAVVASFGVLRRMTSTPFAFFGALLAIVYWGRLTHILNTPYAAPFSVPLTLVTLWLALRANDRRDLASHLLLGLAAGASVWFKQSLGLLNGYALGLAIFGIAMLDGDRPVPSAPASSRERIVALTLWALAALALFVPGNEFLSAREYAIHVLPIHLVMGVVAVTVWRRGIHVSVSDVLRERLGPYVVGFVAALTPMIAAYTAWGALGGLLRDVLVIPTFMQNYAMPIILPPFGVTLFATGVLGTVIGGLFAVRRQWQWAGGIGAGSAALIGFAAFAVPRTNPELYSAAFIWRTAMPFDWIMPSVLVFATIPFLAIACRDVDDPAGRREISCLLPALLVQGFLAYQIFPRAGTNIFTIQGALMPLLVYLGYRAYRFGIARGAAQPGRIVAAVLCGLTAAWLAAPAAVPVWNRATGRAMMRPAALPHTAGITLPWQEYARIGLEDVSQLVDHIERTAPPEARMLLFSSHHMLYFLSDRAPLADRYEYPIFLTGIRMMPVNEIMLAADRETLARLERSPETIVITHDNRTSRWIRNQLPLTAAYIDAHYALDRRFGPYRLLERRSTHEGATPR
jgi:hypothetical protein